MPAGMPAAHLHNIHAVKVRYLKIMQRMFRQRGILQHPEAVKIINNLVLIYQLAEGFPLGLVFRPVVMTSQKFPAEGDQHQDARHDADKADGGERKKAQPLHSGLLKLVVDDKVGGRADQRQHAAHTAGKCHGHEQAARLNASVRSQAHQNRQHQRHRPRIADKGAYAGCNKHGQHQQAQLAPAGQFHDSAAHHFGQARPENGASHHEKPHHHHHNGIGKAGKRLFRAQNPEHNQAEQGTQRDKIRTNPPLDK